MHRPSREPSRPPRLRLRARALRAALALGLLAGPGVGLVVGLHAVAAEPAPPTVVFTRGDPPRSCSSAPTLSSITVPLGTAVGVVNSVGRDATVFVDGLGVLPVPHGSGAEIELAAGQYDLRMVPDCLAFADAEPLSVTVTAAPTGGPSGAASAPGTSAPPALPASATTAAGGSPARATSAIPPSAGASTTLVPAVRASPGDRTAVGTSASAASVLAESGVITARPATMAVEGHPKGVRLLAVVATICVLGVTAAIIRSIVRLSP